MSDITANSSPPAAAGPPPASADAAAPRPFQISLSFALALCFGGLVFLAVAAVLALGAWGARETTLSLLREKSESAMQQMASGIELYMRPVENQLVYIAREIESGNITTESSELSKYFTGALAATPEVRSLVMIHADGRMLRALRNKDHVDMEVIDVRNMPIIHGALEAARGRTGLFWGEVVRPETVDIAVLNLRHPVYKGGQYIGLLAATVQIDQLSVMLDDAARPLNGTAFVLYNERNVLAHPRLIQGLVPRSGDILPTIADIDDSVVAAYGSAPEGRAGRTLAERTGIRLIPVKGREYALLSWSITRYGTVPWEMGVYFPADDLLDELSRLRWAGIAGICVLLVALIVAFGFSRYLSAPLRRLADAAQRISSLSLAQVERQPRSPFVELNVAGQAFNSMVVGLRWFETYVPKKLVEQLVRAAGQEGGSGNTFESQERNVTVMFTDIAKFTTLSESLPAPEVAEILNHHFALVTGCIEAEGGTVDKFIGDCVMAFWGAPEKQFDHAARASRAALAIAEAAKKENIAARATGRPDFSVRIGLHSGPVIVGNIGAPGRVNYTIIGDTVNTASRLEQLGKTLAGDAEIAVILSGTTLKSSQLELDVRSVGTVSVRGRQGQIDVYIKTF